MADTVIAYKSSALRISPSLRACLLYVIADACVSLGQELSSMDKDQWQKMWAMQHLGFWLSQVGSTALMVKAFYSGSSPKAAAPTSNNEPKDKNALPNLDSHPVTGPATV